jgi:hypothetical protein
MSERFPCPNPRCTHSFSREAIRGVASLLCPRCGTTFQFREDNATEQQAVTNKPRTPAKEHATPPKPSPPPLPAAPAVVPVAMPVAHVQPAPDLGFQSKPDLLVSVPRRAGRFPRRTLPLLLALLVAASIIGLAFWALRFRSEMGEEEQVTEQGNFRFKVPGRPWKQDEAAQLRLGVNLAIRRTGPSNALAIYYHDYQTRLPSDAELVDAAVSRLRGYFTRVEYELKPRADATRLGGRPALEMEFEGVDPAFVESNGTCLLMAHRGYSYLFFTWGPRGDREQLAPEWEKLREGFTLLDGREGWKELPRETVAVQGTKVPYRLDAAKDVWKVVPGDGYDPLADLVLLGRDPTEPKHASKVGTLEVLLLPKVDDLKGAIEAAKGYYLKRQKDPDGENYPDTVLAAVMDKEGHDVSRDGPVGMAPGHLAKLHVTNGENRERYVVLGIVSRPEGIVVLKGDCDWQRRDFWEQEFTALIGTFRLVKDR